jgi:hypothetical protein
MQLPPRTHEVPSQGLVQLDIGTGVSLSSAEIGFPIPVTALSSALAAAPPDQQRAVLSLVIYSISDLQV